MRSASKENFDLLMPNFIYALRGRRLKV